jgi:putative transposase
VSEFLQQLVNGITWGSVYALIALGYTMVYGILRLINFAHGDVYMLGAFFAYFLVCIVHMVRNSLNYVNWKERKAVAGDLRMVYHAATVEEAEQRLRDFEEQWDAKYASIGKMWRRNWAGIVPFFAYPAEIRRAVYTTNIVESLNMSLRKVIKTRGSFPGEEAALKLLYLALKNVAKRWKAAPNWRTSLNHFTLLYGDRIEAAWQRPAR